MLLTVPWALSIYGGRVAYDAARLNSGTTTEALIVAQYGQKSKRKKMNTKGMAQPAHGVAPDADKLWKSAMIMALTLVSYVIIQFPAMPFSDDKTVVDISTESSWSAVGMVTTLLLLVANLAFQYFDKDEETIWNQRLAAWKKEVAGELGITFLFGEAAWSLGQAVLEESENWETPAGEPDNWWMNDRPFIKKDGGGGTKEANPEWEHRYKGVIRAHQDAFDNLMATFQKYDTDYNGDISEDELFALVQVDCGKQNKSHLAELFRPGRKDNAMHDYDLYKVKDDKPKLTFWEFVALIIDLANRDRYAETYAGRLDGGAEAGEKADAKLYKNPFFPGRTENCKIVQDTITDNQERAKKNEVGFLSTPRDSMATTDLEARAGGDGDDDDDDDDGGGSGGGGSDSEEDEGPVFIKSEHDERLLSESFKTMAVGSVLVLLFSDPMVDCLSALGARTGVPVFYVSFLLAPLASNASELSSSMKMAEKKDKVSITASLQQCL
eukprot:SAG22_NODE_259_length_13477_cov_10.020407_13_plen_496_part_00